MITVNEDEYMVGDCADDIDEFLRDYSDIPDIDVKPVICHGCGGDVFEHWYDEEEGVAKVKCTACGEEKLLFDSEEYWEDAGPEQAECSLCGKRSFNVRVGFVRRESGEVRWVYVGTRCVNCGDLDCFADWKIDYSPTDEQERNI